MSAAVRVNNITMSLPRPMDLSDAEFRLPRFGIDESVIYPHRPLWWRAFYLFAGGAVLFFFKKKQRPSPDSQTK